MKSIVSTFEFHVIQLLLDVRDGNEVGTDFITYNASLKGDALSSDLFIVHLEAALCEENMV